ncbi:MAG: porin [Rhodobacteraceae bacterium]|nr:porin [Paracoccaceae bacterium]
MKKVLYTTTALVALAGTAQAEVSLSGSAKMGIVGGDDDDRNDEVQFWQDVDVTFGLSGTTDNGLTFGASVDLDESIEDTSKYDDGGTTVFISGGFGTLTMGDTDGALDWAMFEANTAGSPGSIDDAETGHTGYLGSYGDGATSVALPVMPTRRAVVVEVDKDAADYTDDGRPTIAVDGGTANIAVTHARKNDGPQQGDTGDEVPEVDLEEDGSNQDDYDKWIIYRDSTVAHAQTTHAAINVLGAERNGRPLNLAKDGFEFKKDDVVTMSGFDDSASDETDADGQILRYHTNFGDFGVAVSLEQAAGDDGKVGSNANGGSMAIGATYAMALSGMDLSFGAGYQSTDFNVTGDQKIYGLSVRAEMANGFSAALQYSDWSGIPTVRESTLTTEWVVEGDTNNNGVRDAGYRDVAEMDADGNPTGNRTCEGVAVSATSPCYLPEEIVLSAKISGEPADLVTRDDSHIGIGLGYDAAPFAVHVNWGEYDSGASGYGLAAAYDLGGGAHVKLGYGSSSPADGEDTSKWSLGVSMSF